MTITTNKINKASTIPIVNFLLRPFSLVSGSFFMGLHRLDSIFFDARNKAEDLM